MASFLALVVVAILALLVVNTKEAGAVALAPAPEPVPGLSYTYYESSCPQIEFIIRNHLSQVLQNDITQAAGLLRLHFHDCFVLGCDGSVLLDGSASGPSEKNAPPNLSLRAEGFQIINDLQALLQEECGQVVSCADITALAARDSVFLSGGPNYSIPLGRKDSLNFATTDETLANLPSPFSTTTTILNSFATKNLSTIDAVALSGGHTIGRGQCSSFTNRLYPTQDPIMEKNFANKLKNTCPSANTINTTALDLRSPNKFDNKYFVNLMNRQGLFTSDQDLYSDSRSKGIVTSFALSQGLFFDSFVSAMIQMGQFNVLTGTQGEIRANCSTRNGDSNFGLWSLVDDDKKKGRFSQY